MNALTRRGVRFKCSNSSCEETAPCSVRWNRKIIFDAILIYQCAKSPFAGRWIILIKGKRSRRYIDSVKRAGLCARNYMRFA